WGTSPSTATPATSCPWEAWSKARCTPWPATSACPNASSSARPAPGCGRDRPTKLSWGSPTRPWTPTSWKAARPRTCRPASKGCTRPADTSGRRRPSLRWPGQATHDVVIYPVDMQIVLVGLNHKSAPVAVRERLAFGPDQATSSLRRLVDAGELAETAILSTCNRTEVYGAVDDGDLGTEAVIGILCAFSGQPPEAVRPYLYQYTGAAAARHLARVAAGLDSMLIGEAQILGQVRAALRLSQEAGTAGPHVTRLFEAALRAGKRARAETAIGEG